MSEALVIFSSSIGNIKNLDNDIDVSTFDFVITDDERIKGNNVILLSGFGTKNLVEVELISPITNFSFNDIDKFVLSPLSEIIQEITSKQVSSVFLYKGGRAVTFPTVASEHLESRYNLLASKADVFNPLLSLLLDKKYNISWIKRRNTLFCHARILLRALLLFLLSFIESFRNRTRFYAFDDKVVVLRSDFQKRKALELFPQLHPKISKTSFKSLLDYFSKSNLFKSNKILYNFKTFHIQGFWANLEYFILLDSLLRKIKIDHVNPKKELITFETSSRFALIDGTFAGKVSSYQLTNFPLFLKIKKLPFGKFYVKNQYSLDYLHSVNFRGSSEIFNWPLKKFKKNNSRILFCSQPYGQSILEQWLDDLIALDLTLKERVVMRKHPRDSYSYAKISNWINMDTYIDSDESLSRSSIVVGLSSTILTDAYSHNCKSISINVDEFTKKFNSSFKKETQIVQVSNIDELHQLLLT